MSVNKNESITEYLERVLKPKEVTHEEIAEREKRRIEENARIDRDGGEIFKMAEEASKELFKKQFQPIKNVYMDIQLLVDTNIGAIMNSKVVDAESHAYFTSKIKEYDSRNSTFMSNIFTEFFNSEQEFRALLDDRESDRKVSLISPPTQYLNNFEWVIELINEKRKFSNYKGNWELYINTYPFEFDDKAKQRIEDRLQVHDLRMDVNFICTKHNRLEIDFVKKCDIMYFYDAQPWIGVDGPNKEELIRDNMYLEDGKKIYACCLIPDDLDKKGQSDDDTLLLTLQAMNTVTDFNFINIPKLIKD
jgi:hypothetical protein